MLVEFVTPLRDLCWSHLFLKDSTPAGAVHEDRRLMEGRRSHIGKVKGGLSAVGGTAQSTAVEQGKSMKKKEQQRQCMMN